MLSPTRCCRPPGQGCFEGTFRSAVSDSAVNRLRLPTSGANNGLMLGHPTFSGHMAAERRARFAAEAASARLRRLLFQPHPVPPCAGLAAQLPAVALDPHSVLEADAEPTATR